MTQLRDAVKQLGASTGGPVLILEGAISCTLCGGSRRATVLLGLGNAPVEESATVRQAQVVEVAACASCGRPRRSGT